MANLTDVRSGIKHGLAWSAIGNAILRLGSLVLGIFLARMLSPDDFGVYAVALSVQAVMMTLADFGLSADLIRSKDHQRKARTVATVSISLATLLTLSLALGSEGLAALLGAPEAGPVLAVMSLTFVIAGLGVVPYATLQRTFQQRTMFCVSLGDFLVSTVVTIVLVVAGFGVMSLAVARVLAQMTSVALQFALTGEKLRFGFDRTVFREVLAFGMPIAAANLLSWVLLGADKVVLSVVSGTVALGFYYLAFNISNWPMSVFGQIVRSVSLATFAHVAIERRDSSLAVALAPVWTVAVLTAALIGALAYPVISLLYGDKWILAGPILLVLAAFGAVRTVLDLATAYLMARGASFVVLWLQLGWMAVLLPVLWWAANAADGIGAATAHVLSSVVLMVFYAVALHRRGVDLRAIWRALWPPMVAVGPAVSAAWWVSGLVEAPILQILFGGLTGTAVYVGLLGRWFVRRLAVAKALGQGQSIRGQTTEPDGEPGPLTSKAAKRAQTQESP